MKPREYILMLECVERGAQYGVNRAYKHNDTPDTDAIALAVVDAVMNEISEAWHFDDDPTG